MSKLYRDSNILNKAIAALRAEAGIVLELLPVSDSDMGALKLPHQDAPINVAIKTGIRPSNVGFIAHQLKSCDQPYLLATDYVSPTIGKALRELGIQFIDVCGNAYLNSPPVYVHILGKKPTKDALADKKSKNKAFDATGLKLIYGFLYDRTLINASYREISDRTGVALGSIGSLLDDLRECGYLLQQGTNSLRDLIDKRKLIERWAESYAERLRPKLLVGEFVSDNPDWWKTIEIEQYGAYWGGEVAAAKYTGYLQPEAISMYLPASAGNSIMAAARLQKAPMVSGSSSGLVSIYRPFWENAGAISDHITLSGTVHPILVYADLIASADSRNIETAQLLYDKVIDNFLSM
jgi:hypothetical protein